MAGKRYEVKPYTSLVDMFPWPETHSCEVKDRQTGARGDGHGATPEAAEKAAWQDLKDKQGPPPSQRQ